jgi:hypothetical protein
MSIFNIISQLQAKLSMSQIRQEFEPYEVEELFGPGFNAQYPPYTDDPEDDYIDVPDAVDTKYTTFRVITQPRGKKAGSNYLPFPSESALKEQEKDKEKAKERETASDEVATNVAAKAEREVGAETGKKIIKTNTSDESSYDRYPTYSNLSIPSDLMGYEEEPKTAGELGRIYELKKIYARLTSLESYLADESSGELNEIRQYIAQAIELFEIVSANFSSYKDRLDEIIIMYYKFILEIYNSVKNFYKKEASSGDK